jgi:hypothetical protein
VPLVKRLLVVRNHSPRFLTSGVPVRVVVPYENNSCSCEEQRAHNCVTAELATSMMKSLSRVTPASRRYGL